MDIAEKRHQFRKAEKKFYLRYIEILKTHVKESLTDEEKNELKMMGTNCRALREEEKKLCANAKEQLAILVEQLAVLESEQKQAESQLAVLLQNPCSNEKDHDIVVNCCGTKDGKCLR